MKTFQAFIFLLSLNAAMAAKPGAAPAAPVAPAKAAEPVFNEEKFQELMKLWDEKIKLLEVARVSEDIPKDIFQVAENIIAMNPDQFLNLAEDLSRFTAKRSKLLAPLKKQWLPFSLRPVFVGSAGETLFETAERLANEGNG